MLKPHLQSKRATLARKRIVTQRQDRTPVAQQPASNKLPTSAQRLDRTPDSPSPRVSTNTEVLQHGGPAPAQWQRHRLRHRHHGMLHDEANGRARYGGRNNRTIAVQDSSPKFLRTSGNGSKNVARFLQFGGMAQNPAILPCYLTLPRANAGQRAEFGRNWFTDWFTAGWTFLSTAPRTRVSH